MKTITVHISEEVLARLNTGLTMRMMNGQVTVIEAAVARLVEALQAGQTEVEIALKPRNAG